MENHQGGPDRSHLVGTVLVLVVAALSTLTALLFSGTLRKTVPLTLSRPAGLVMERPKVSCAAFSRRSRILGRTQCGRTDLSTESEDLPWAISVPAEHVEAEIKSSTAFGAKYVDLICL